MKKINESANDVNHSELQCKPINTSFADSLVYLSFLRRWSKNFKNFHNSIFLGDTNIREVGRILEKIMQFFYFKISYVLVYYIAVTI